MVPLDDAQAVACLDIRVFNTDRHPGNLLLVGERPHKAACIDHGCVLPAWWALDCAQFDAWLGWPQVRAPPSPATVSLVKEAVEQLPETLEELERLELSTQAQWTLRICTLWLQRAVLTHCLPLRSIALLMVRTDPPEPCWLEHQVAQACRDAGISSKFVPEGKYQDLVFHVDHKFLQAFALGKAEWAKRAEKLFFSALDALFSSEKAKEEALEAENYWL
mmetsp:Transcript_11332/g.27149  ORF Transcript_11332/g.27149 Transcript_11332/m.27149 type:complete len:220 (-) Transcript_11332:192-851(-)